VKVGRSGAGSEGPGSDAAIIPVLWIGLPALTLGFIALRTASAVGPVVLAASQAVFLAAAWLSVAGSVMALRIAGEQRERRMWAALAVACIAVAAGETYLSGYQVFVDVRGPSMLSLSDALFASGAVAFAVGLAFSASVTQASRLVTARRVVDVCGLATVVFSLAYAVIAFVEPAAGFLVDHLAEAAYAMVGILIVTGTVVEAFASRHLRQPAWKRVLSIALGIFGAAVILSPLWLSFSWTEDVRFQESAVASMFLWAYYLVFVAAFYRSRTSANLAGFGIRTADEVLGGPHWDSVVTSTILLISIPALGVSALWAGIDREHAMVNLVAMGVVGVAMVAHTALDAIYTGRLRRRAGTDPLTGLPDARALQNRLAEAITAFGRYDDPVSVIVFDLTDFARINTLYGRDEGDRLMREVAGVLPSVMPVRAVLGRLGSDEFMAILEGSDRAGALVIAARMRESLHALLTSAGLPLTASWGVASCPQDTKQPRGLVTKAYSAQHWAKTRGRNQLASYDATRMRALDQVARITAAEEQADLALLLAIVTASEARHETTRFHSRNVAAMSVLVAEETGAAQDDVRDVEIAALLHDVGKTGVADQVLMKRAPRSRAEETHFREHVLIGERIVSATQTRRLAPVIRAHHERWDGSGYPDGLSMGEIPRLARIIAVCDAFEGLTSGRPDRRPLSVDAALQELDQNMGIAYDPDVVEALLAVAGSLSVTRQDDEGEVSE